MRVLGSPFVDSQWDNITLSTTISLSDNKVRERLLRESNLTLAKADEICRAAESMILQMKVVEDRSDNTVNFVKTGKEPPPRCVNSGKPIYRECWSCWYRHEHKKELCPAFGKTCNKCNKRNHFAAKCRSKQKAGAIQALDEDGEEVFQTGLGSLDDSQTVTVKLESGSYLHFCHHERLRLVMSLV